MKPKTTIKLSAIKFASFLLLCGLQLLTSLTMQAQITVTPWRMNPDGGELFLLSPLAFNGDPDAYTYASIPPTGDPNWVPAPLDIFGDIQFGGIGTSQLTAPCLYSLDFTYFDINVDIPLNTVISTFTVTFSQVDDGARAYVFNSLYPSGAYIPGGDIILGGPPVTADLSSLAVVGEINRVVIVQFDDCTTDNNLDGANIVVNGIVITPFSLACPGDTTVYSAPGLCGRIVQYPLAVAQGTPNPTVSYSQTTGTFFPVGTTTVTVTASNTNNIDSCSFTITVLDTIPPIIYCTPSVRVYSDSGLCGAKVCYNNPVIAENCSPVTPDGYHLITTFGNSYYYQSNSLSDYPTAESNAVAAGGHLAVITSSLEDSAIGTAGASGWLGGNDLITDGIFQWADCEPFSYVSWCPGEPNGGTGENYLQYEGLYCFNDLYESALSYSILEIEGAKMYQIAGLPQNSIFPIGTTTNTFVAVDAAGNSDTCSFTVTVKDVEAPHAICKNITIELDSTGKTVYIDSAFVGPVAGNLPQQGDSTTALNTTCDCPAGYVAVGYEGLAGCILDDFRLNCRQLLPNGTLGLSTSVTCFSSSQSSLGSGPYELPPNEALVGVTINSANYAFSPYLTHLEIKGEGKPICNIIAGVNNTIGNTSLTPLSGVGCGFIGTPTASTVYAPNGYVITGMSAAYTGSYGSNVSFRYSPIKQIIAVNDGSYDNCGISCITVTPDSFNCSNVGNNKVELTVTDVNGNYSTCSATVTVKCSVTPHINCVRSFCAGKSTVLDAGAGYAHYLWSTGAISRKITVNSGGTYTVTVTNSCGCTGSDSVVIIVYPLPSVSFSGLASTYNVNASPATLTGSPSGGTFSGKGISGNKFYPSVAGIGGPYTITYTYTNVHGCSKSVSKQTSVTGNCIIPGKPGAISGPENICPGETKTYSISPVAYATSYLWTAPAGATIVYGQGTTSVKVSYSGSFYSNGNLSVAAVCACGSSQSNSLYITKNSAPAKPGSITGPSSVCKYKQSVPYSIYPVNGASNYSWLAPTGGHIKDGIYTSSGNSLTTTSTSIKVNFGSYAGYVKVKANNACGSSAYSQLYIGIGCRESFDYAQDDFGSAQDVFDVICYPVPASGNLNVSFQSEQETANSIRITDMLGKTLLQQNKKSSLGENLFTIDVSAISNGIYMIEVRNGDQVSTQKIMIE